MAHTPLDLCDRVAVVSGAASGLGKAMATALAEVSADVVLVDEPRRGQLRLNAENLFTRYSCPEIGAYEPF